MTVLGTGQPPSFLQQVQDTVYSVATSSYSVKSCEWLIQTRDQIQRPDDNLNNQVSYIGKIAVVELGFVILPLLALTEAVVRLIFSLGVFAFSAIFPSDQSRDLSNRCLDQSVGSLGISVVAMYCLYANVVHRDSLEGKVNEFVRA